MRVTFADFAAFVIAACFVVAVFVAPYIMAWHYLDSHFSREAAHDSRPLAEGSGLARPGAPNAPSRPGNPVLPTGEKGGAMLPSSDPARCLSVLGEARGSAEGDLVDTQVPDDGQRDRTRAGSANAANGVTAGETAQIGTLPSRTDDTQVEECWGVKRGPSRVGVIPNEYAHAGNVAPKSGVTGWRDSHFASRASYSPALILSGGRSPDAEVSGGSSDGFVWRRDVLAASHLCDLAPGLIASVVTRESQWDPRAVSSQGAVGLMQLMPATARMMGVTDRTDPAQSLLGGACYLRLMLERYKGDERRALIAYHRGAWAKGPTPQASHDYASDVIQGAN